MSFSIAFYVLELFTAHSCNYTSIVARQFCMNKCIIRLFKILDEMMMPLSFILATHYKLLETVKLPQVP